MKMTRNSTIGGGVLAVLTVSLTLFLNPSISWNSDKESVMGFSADVATLSGDQLNSNIKREIKVDGEVNAIEIADENVTIISHEVRRVVITGLPESSLGVKKVWIWRDDKKIDSGLIIEYKEDSFFDCGCATPCLVEGD